MDFLFQWMIWGYSHLRKPSNVSVSHFEMKIWDDDVGSDSLLGKANAAMSSPQFCARCIQQWWLWETLGYSCNVPISKLEMEIDGTWKNLSKWGSRISQHDFANICNDPIAALDAWIPGTGSDRSAASSTLGHIFFHLGYPWHHPFSVIRCDFQKKIWTKSLTCWFNIKFDLIDSCDIVLVRLGFLLKLAWSQLTQANSNERERRISLINQRATPQKWIFCRCFIAFHTFFISIPRFRKPRDRHVIIIHNHT